MSTLQAKEQLTRKPSCRRQTCATRKHAKNCSNLTCLQCYRWLYWSIYLHSFSCCWLLHPKSAKFLEILWKFKLIRVQGHPRPAILVQIKSTYVLSY